MNNVEQFIISLSAGIVANYIFKFRKQILDWFFRHTNWMPIIVLVILSIFFFILSPLAFHLNSSSLYSAYEAFFVIIYLAFFAGYFSYYNYQLVE